MPTLNPCKAARLRFACLFVCLFVCVCVLCVHQHTNCYRVECPAACAAASLLVVALSSCPGPVLAILPKHAPLDSSAPAAVGP